MSVGSHLNNTVLQPNEPLIYWTTQGDCESAMRAIDEYVDGKSCAASRVPGGSTIPKYVQDNLASRHGRHAAGTVWDDGITTGTNDFLKTKWKDDNDFHQFIQAYCGGVLFYARDVNAIMTNVGFVTDMHLRIILKVGVLHDNR